MNNNNDIDLLADELNKAGEENENFLTDIDKKIKAADLEYAQTIIDEEKGYLKFAKKTLEEKNN